MNSEDLEKKAEGFSAEENNENGVRAIVRTETRTIVQQVVRHVHV